MNRKQILNYLTALEQNNNREWFHENKAQYQAAKGEFEALVRELMLELHQSDSSIPLAEPKSLTFKLQRDTRFSRDKSPYNPSFRAHISRRGKLPIPVGYFLMVQPGGRSFLGGGLFADMFKDATAMVRSSIQANGDEWQQIITAPGFRECFIVSGSALKKVPQGYDPQHPQAAYLKHKSWYLEYTVPDEQFLDSSFTAFATDIFLKMRPFNSFLNRALEGFQMPSR